MSLYFLFGIFLSVFGAIVCYAIASWRGSSVRVWTIGGAIFGPFAIPFSFIKRKKQTVRVASEISGVKGWLLLLLVEISAAALLHLAAVIYMIYLFVGVSVGEFDPDMAWAEICVSSAFVGIWAVGIYLVATGKLDFRAAAIAILLIDACFAYYIDSVVVGIPDGENGSGAASWYALRVMLWVPYILLSDRVRNTFVPYPANNSLQARRP